MSPRRHCTKKENLQTGIKSLILSHYYCYNTFFVVVVVVIMIKSNLGVPGVANSDFSLVGNDRDYPGGGNRFPERGGNKHGAMPELGRHKHER